MFRTNSSDMQRNKGTMNRKDQRMYVTIKIF